MITHTIFLSLLVGLVIIVFLNRLMKGEFNYAFTQCEDEEDVLLLFVNERVVLPIMFFYSTFYMHNVLCMDVYFQDETCQLFNGEENKCSTHHRVSSMRCY